MILSFEDIAAIIKNNPQKHIIDDAKKKHEVLKMHCTGEGIDKYVKEEKEFMRPGMKDTLVNLMRSNKDLITRVMAPRNKIYTAKGGIEQYNLPEDVEPEFREYLSQIADGMPVKEWIRQRVQPRYDFDPNGVVFIEINADKNPYPCIKGIECIYDYLPNGRALEYLFLIIEGEERANYQNSGLLPADLKKGQKVFRVIDDISDCLVVCDNKYAPEGMQITSEIPNEFGYVPAIIISDMFGIKEGCFDSPLSASVELLDDFMYSVGTYKLAYMRQAFPKEWMQLTDCPTCDGQGLIDGEKCPECKGKKIMPYMKQSDVVLADFRADSTGKGSGVPTPPMGVVTPAVEALQFMKDNGMSLEDYFQYTMWGVAKVMPSTSVRTSTKVAGHGSGNVSNTAYEAQLNDQPRQDKQKTFGSWKDSIQKFVVDTCGWYKYRDLFEGSAIVCGDRFMNESADATWDRYTKAVLSKAPMSILDSLLIEYIENKYNHNPLLYRKYYLLMQVEPFVHEDVSVIWIDNLLPLTTRLEKKYFDEWTSTLTDYDIASVPEEGGADILREQLKEYVIGHYTAGVQGDALLLSGTGQVINMGDKVTVKAGKEQKPEHEGKTYTVNDIKGTNLTLSGNGVDGIFGYQIGDVCKVNTKTLAAA